MKPREKLLKKGADNLSLQELSSLMIGSGVGKRSFKAISADLSSIIDAASEKDQPITVEQIKDIKGLGIAKSSNIIAGIEVGRRLYDKGYKSRVKILTTKDGVNFFREISSKRQEYLKAAYLNARYEVIAKETIAIGTIDQVGLYPRDVLSKALLHNAYGIIIAHNHPSGDPTPSNADLTATKRLYKACNILGIKLMDHIVLSDENWCRIDF